MRQVDINFSPTISSNNPDQTNLIEDFALAKMDLASVHFVELPIQGLRSRQVKSEQCVELIYFLQDQTREANLLPEIVKMHIDFHLARSRPLLLEVYQPRSTA